MSQRGFDLVAYYYPGWHASAWKLLDEWKLLDDDRPYFETHLPLDRPLRGYYDDSLSSTLDEQLNIAQSSGVKAFTFFLYYGPSGFVLDGPTRGALQLASQTDKLQVGITWCMRLPHQYFPIPLIDDDAPIATAEPRLDVQSPSNAMVGDIIPVELMDTAANTFVRLATGKPAPGRMASETHTTECMAKGDMMKSATVTVDNDLVVPAQDADPTLAEVVAFLERMAAVLADRSWNELSLLEVETQLALCGLLNLPVFSVKAFCELAAILGLPTVGQAIVDRLPVESIVKALTGVKPHIDPADIRHIAALGAGAADTQEVFSIISLGALVEGLREAAQQALSLRHIRIAVEGIAYDLTQNRRQ